MPSAPVPPPVEDLLLRRNPSVLGCVRPDGTPVTAACWYLWEDGRALLTFAAHRARLRFIQQNPAVSLTVLDSSDWVRNVTLFGRVTTIHDDVDLGQADRLAQHYLGQDYPDREGARVFGYLEVDRYFFWDAHAEVAIEPQRLG